VPDESEDDMPSTRKRKRASPQATPKLDRIATEDQEIPSESTARKWTFDANTQSSQAEVQTPKPKSSATPAKTPKPSEKVDTSITPWAQKHPWLTKPSDIDRHPPDHPDYDPRTIYIPPQTWNNFSAFEKQYWEIKQKFMDTVVFFKKGKFYELYENDAVLGEREFDLKRTFRVGMGMVGVPEASLDHWANQFVAKGYKIARVDQMESALGKEMREREGAKASQKEKIIRRELATVLTAGTLVDGGMLQGDQATYCVAIREQEVDNLPTFGIAFVDTATAQFHLVDIEDDADMTKFETFVAQIRPAELLLERSCLSAKATRILKNNTNQTTIWNWLKPTKEFWPGDIAAREVEASAYFLPKEGSDDDPWPKALREATEKEMVMSAFGALIQYLRKLLIDKELVSLGNIQWYDPIRKATNLVLDGQSLINLEIFANSFDGGSDGTLFQMLNRCVTPFGKRLLRQWVCHPLADAGRINERLDAVESLMADPATIDQFAALLTKLPDLERLISRVHAGRCSGKDFSKVLQGFEQIDYTMGQLGSFGAGEGLIGRLLTSMPDLATLLKPWKTAFDKELADKEGILMPQPGVEVDFDETAGAITDCESQLQELLVKARKTLGSSAICFRDNGKEIYQLEVPVKIQNVPEDWDQMSATKQVKRYYSPKLRRLVKDLQEARESHALIVKEVASRFYVRFDQDYTSWLSAINVVSQLDCLISLSRASSALGTPSCRPVFLADEDIRTTISFTDLRHPTMLTSVSDFIPNSINLGGYTDDQSTTNPNINLLTGANAAGKSTILRMTCIAVILAQLGCHLPCEDATLTPCDRIMSRLGANDNILQQQSTFFVELAETKKILQEATSRSLVILDELGRGTSSVDGLAVAEAVLHHIAGHVGCTGFFATHYHSLAHEFANHPEVAAKRMAIAVEEEEKRVTFLYRLEDGVAEGSFGMHCAAMCGIHRGIIENAEKAAEEWEHSGRMLKESTQKKIGMGEGGESHINLGWLSDVAWMLKEDADEDIGAVNDRALDVLVRAIETM